MNAIILAQKHMKVYNSTVHTQPSTQDVKW